MDNKKIVAVSVLAVLALAFAGYGYADYTASTYNSDNYIATQYITLTPVTFDAMAPGGEDLEKIDMNTWTYYDSTEKEIKTIWALDGDADEATDDMLTAAGITLTDGEAWAVTVGQTLDIEVDTSAGSAEKYDLTLDAIDAEFGADYAVLMSVAIGNDTFYIDITNPEAVEVAAATESITVGLVFLVVYDTEMTDFPGIQSQWGADSEPADAGEILSEAAFIFRLAPQA